MATDMCNLDEGFFSTQQDRLIAVQERLTEISEMSAPSDPGGVSLESVLSLVQSGKAELLNNFLKTLLNFDKLESIVISRNKGNTQSNNLSFEVYV